MLPLRQASASAQSHQVKGALPFAGVRGRAPGEIEKIQRTSLHSGEKPCAWDWRRILHLGILSLITPGVITALFIGEVRNIRCFHLYSPMLFNGSIASVRMTSIGHSYKPESQWASVAEVRQECGLHFGILILDDMDPPLTAGGALKRVVGGPHHSPPAPIPVRRAIRARFNDHFRRGT